MIRLDFYFKNTNLKSYESLHNSGKVSGKHLTAERWKKVIEAEFLHKLRERSGINKTNVPSVLFIMLLIEKLGMFLLAKFLQK